MGGRGIRHNSKVIWPGFTEIKPRHVVKVGRNELCPCGSARKYKDCHESQGTAYLEKLALEQDRKRRRQELQRMRDQGVPWYRRLLYWF